MTWLEIAALALVGLGLFAGAFLVAQRPAFWAGLGMHVFKALLPKLQELFRRMPEKEEKHMLSEKRAGRGDEWLKNWHRGKRG